MPKPYFKNKQDYIDEVLRVNYAGEYAANIIYQTQINNSRDIDMRCKLQDMLVQEKKHLEFFQEEMRKNYTRPSALMPVWHLLSIGLGKISAKLSNKHIMLTTQAVEEVIEGHYAKQIYILKELDLKELRDNIVLFRQDELEHMHEAEDILSNKKSFLDDIFFKCIKVGCLAAIAICKKI
jgi:ubiquinone biosynthesis monooxygenase Coq7